MFHALHFWPVVHWNLTRDQLNQELRQWVMTRATKYAVFYFIRHGGGGDVLFMEDGGVVRTEEILKNFRQFSKNIYTFWCKHR